jgi:hypothetical protein
VALGLLIWQTLPRHVTDARFLLPSERAWLASASAGARKHAEQAEALGGRRMLAEALGNGRLWLIMLTGIMKNSAMTGWVGGGGVGWSGVGRGGVLLMLSGIGSSQAPGRHSPAAPCLTTPRPPSPFAGSCSLRRSSWTRS